MSDDLDEHMHTRDDLIDPLEQVDLHRDRPAVTTDRHHRIHLVTDRELAAMRAVAALGGCEVRVDAWGHFIRWESIGALTDAVSRLRDPSLRYPAGDVVARVRAVGR